MKRTKQGHKNNKTRNFKKFYIALIIISVSVFLLSVIARSFPWVVEYVYSRFLYKIISQTVGLIFGIFPVPAAEILLYAGVAALIVFTLYSLIKAGALLIKRKKKPFSPLLVWFLTITTTAMILYSCFGIMWGFNYSRQPFAVINNWEIKESPVSELYNLCVDLANKCNESRKSVKTDPDGIMISNTSINDTLKRARIGYDNASRIFPSLKGSYSRPKAVISSKLMCYANLTGITVPFTYEANVNILSPASSLLHTTMHEMAHQRGFAREDEANFVGYLACKYHPDADFQYSGYYLALTYSLNALTAHDKEKSDKVWNMLSQGVRNDMTYEYKFWKQFEGPLQKVSENINDSYLKANNQKDGIYSYGRVVDLLLAERRVG